MYTVHLDVHSTLGCTQYTWMYTVHLDSDFDESACTSSSYRYLEVQLCKYATN